MSVNSPVVSVAVPRREARGAVATLSRRRGPGAHRVPGVTVWRTSMHELIYFLTIGYVQPWRRSRPAIRSAS